MLDVVLKVSTEEMLHRSDAIKESVNSIRVQFEEIEKRVRHTSGYWEGEASELHMTRFNKIKESCDEIVKRLSEHPDDLLKMAGIYNESENTSVENANSLQSNVIL